jgi:arylsulfatase A-like enzyme
VRDAFYKWDGYSYYMKFYQFLPDLSLAFILWTAISAIFAGFLWLTAYIMNRISRQLLAFDNMEYYVTCLLAASVIMFVKRMNYSNLSITKLTGLNHMLSMFVGGVVIASIIFIGRKHVGRILSEFDSRISPLIWAFGVCLIISFPISMTGSPPPKARDKFLGDVSTSLNNRPNIILVTWDTLAARDMSLYGYERPTTPFLSRWAKDAIVFKKAYSSSNWTTPSAMTMMTGKRVWTHKVWYRAYFNPVQEYEQNIAKILGENGYEVYGFVQNMYAHPSIIGMSRYFTTNSDDIIFHVDNEWWLLRIGRLLGSRYVAREWIIGSFLEKQLSAFTPRRYTPTFQAENVYNPALELLAERKDLQASQPLFLWLHTLPPHDPYYPPEPFLGVFEDKEDKTISRESLLHREVAEGSFGPAQQEAVDKLRRRYDEFILYSDSNLEKFMSRLSRTIDLSNTVIIFSSDHGESFSHGYLSHDGPHLFEEFVHIPLIIKMPAMAKGKKIEMPVGQVDIAPTILDLAGIQVPDWMEGRSLLPLIEGKDVEPRPVFSMQLIRNRSFGRRIDKGTIAVWDGEYKLIYYLDKGEKLLFNLKNDPGEAKNIFNDKLMEAEKLSDLINTNLTEANEMLMH